MDGNGAGVAPVISAHRVVKTFGQVRALRGAPVEAYPGEVTALVGDNGAGKSTLIKILAGVQPPDEGEVRVDRELVRFGEGAATPALSPDIREGETCNSASCAD